MNQHATADTPVTYPRRHGCDQARARRSAALFLRQVPGAEQVSVGQAEWDLYGRGLVMGDPLADDVVAWMRQHGQAEAWKMVNAAIERGLPAVPAAPPPLRAFISHVETRPDWVREELLIEGARACNLGGLAAMRALLVTGLMAGYQLAAVNQTLLATGALEKGASRRIAETTKWWADVTRPGAMARFADGFKGTLRVRLIHAMVRSHVSAQPSWDAADLGVPVSQTDMQVTYLGFSIVYLLSMKLVGVFVSQAEREAVMHLWRYIAWLNGVQEPYLHSVEGGERSAMLMFYGNLLHQRMADADSARLATSLADEALHRQYPSMAWWMGRYNRSLQLSIARLCMDPETRREMGLTAVPLLPWYPMLMVPFNAVLHGLARLLPGGRAWLSRRGRRQQEAYLPILFGRQDQTLRDIGAVKVQGSR